MRIRNPKEKISSQWVHSKFLTVGYSKLHLTQTDHNLLVYGVDSKGDEEFSLRFRNLVTLEWLDDEIVGCGWTVRWAADNRTVLYTKVFPCLSIT